MRGDTGEDWSDIDKTLAKKREFYSVVIGGNPGADQWTFGSDMIVQPVQEVTTTAAQNNPIPSALEHLGGHEVVSDEEDEEPFSGNEDAVGGGHFFNFELPLDSDKEEEK